MVMTETYYDTQLSRTTVSRLGIRALQLNLRYISWRPERSNAIGASEGGQEDEAHQKTSRRECFVHVNLSEFLD